MIEDKPDWRLIFGTSWRKPPIQEHLDKWFKGRSRVKVSREQLEEMVVTCCALILEEYTDKRRN